MGARAVATFLYVADRNRVPAAAQDRDVRNLVVITGDRHQNYAWDLKRDYADPTSRRSRRSSWARR
jgi:phosphodiesterase/alkaline phosphatase D-like protein